MSIGEQLLGDHELSCDMQSVSKPTVLFVDDEESVLKGLNRFMRTRRHSWTSRFAGGGTEAIDVLSEGAIDMVVTDMRMPGVDGAALLEWVSVNRPGTIRFVLSGEANVDETYRIVGRSHQFLAKPCKPEKLADTIASTLVGPWAKDISIGCDTTSFLDCLKTHRDVHRALELCLWDADSTPAEAAQIISSDPGLSARVLQVVNSAYFGRPLETASIDRAVTSLGLDHLRALVEQSRLGQATNELVDARWDAVYGPFARACRAYGATLTQNREVLDTIYATALFSGLGSIIGELRGTASTASAAFTATLLGFPPKLSAALGILCALKPCPEGTDLIEPVCNSVMRVFEDCEGGQLNV